MYNNNSYVQLASIQKYVICELLPVITPLSRPGMPLIAVKLFWTKYSSHVALRKGELQNFFHSSVV